MKTFKLKDRVYLTEGLFLKHLTTPCDFCKQRGKVLVNEKEFGCPYCFGSGNADVEPYETMKLLSLPFKVVSIHLTKSIKSGKYQESVGYSVEGKISDPTSNGLLSVCWERWDSNKIFGTKKDAQKYVDDFNGKAKAEAEKKSKKHIATRKVDAALQKPVLYSCHSSY